MTSRQDLSPGGTRRDPDPAAGPPSDVTRPASRRRFLRAAPAALFAAANAAARAADDRLHLLKGNDLERLRLDFNASRSKVRLFFLLSPT